MESLPCRTCKAVLEGSLEHGETCSFAVGFSCQQGVELAGKTLSMYGEDNQQKGEAVCRFYDHVPFCW